MTGDTEGKDGVAKAQNSVRQKVDSAIAVVRDKSDEIIADTREKSFRAANETTRIFQEHPIAAVAAAAAAGAVLAIFIPKFAVASQAGAAASKVGLAAKQAASSKIARNAAQIVLATVAKNDVGAVAEAVSKATQTVTKRVRAVRSKAGNTD